MCPESGTQRRAHWCPYFHCICGNFFLMASCTAPSFSATGTGGLAYFASIPGISREWYATCGIASNGRHQHGNLKQVYPSLKTLSSQEHQPGKPDTAPSVLSCVCP